MLVSTILWLLMEYCADPSVLAVHSVGVAVWGSLIGSPLLPPLTARVCAVGVSEATLLLAWLLGYAHGGLYVAIEAYVWIRIFETVAPSRGVVRKNAVFVKGECQA